MYSKTNAKYILLVLAALVAFGPLSIDMYLPGLPLIANDLLSSEAQIQLTISFFLAGFSFGMLFYGPLSDKYGRRWLLLSGIAIYILASLGCFLVTNSWQLIILRCCQALGGASASVLARAIARDMFELRQSARVLSHMHIITMVATLIAPLFGGYLILFAGWRILFLVLAFWGVMCFCTVFFLVPETHSVEARQKSLSKVFFSYWQILTNLSAVGYIFCMSFSFGGMFAYITASPFVYINIFNISSQNYAWLFSLNIFGIMLMTLLNGRLVLQKGPQKMLKLGASITSVAALLLIIFGSSGIGGLYSIVICLFFYVSCTGLLGANCIASLMSLFPQQAGAAAGIAVAVQFAMGTALSTLVSFLHDGSTMPMSLVVGCAGIACSLALWLTYRKS